MKNLEDTSCIIYDRIVDLENRDAIFKVSELV